MMGKRSDLQTALRAIQNRWEVPPEVAQQILEDAAVIARESPFPRERLAAGKLLLAADKTSLEATKLQMALLASEPEEPPAPPYQIVIDPNMSTEELMRLRERYVEEEAELD